MPIDGWRRCSAPLDTEKLLEVNLLARGQLLPQPPFEVAQYMSTFTYYNDTGTLLSNKIKATDELLRSMRLDLAVSSGHHHLVMNRCAEVAFDYAMLHPYYDGNGRTRTLLLNHCLTSHGLHSVLMYDNNRGMIQMKQNQSVYTQTVLEGYCLWELAVNTGENPWVQQDTIDRHNQKFGRSSCDHGEHEGHGGYVHC